jgi:hypothetical protein
MTKAKYAQVTWNMGKIVGMKVEDYIGKSLHCDVGGDRMLNIGQIVKVEDCGEYFKIRAKILASSGRQRG